MFDSKERLALFISFATSLILVGGMSIGSLAVDSMNDINIPELEVIPIEYVKPEETGIVIEVVDAHTEEPEEIKPPTLSDKDIMAIVAMCEAGNQELIGKVAVVATILNRCDYYGKTVESVVYEPNQYSFNPNTVPNEDCYLAVEIAMRERQLFPATMMWFLPDDWSPYGEHYMPIQAHYFSYLPEEEE